MMIPFTCPSCGHTMGVPGHYAGRELFCASCKARFTAPHAVPAATRSAQLMRPATASGSRIAIAATLIVVVVVAMGIIAAIAVPNLLNAINRGRQKRTMADMRTIAGAINAYRVDKRTFPAGVTSIGEIQEHLVPAYLTSVPVHDGWRRPLEIWTSEDGEAYTIVSLGCDGQEGSRPGGPTTAFDDDIVLHNGTFWQWPQGMAP